MRNTVTLCLVDLIALDLVFTGMSSGISTGISRLGSTLIFTGISKEGLCLSIGILRITTTTHEERKVLNIFVEFVVDLFTLKLRSASMTKIIVRI